MSLIFRAPPALSTNGQGDASAASLGTCHVWSHDFTTCLGAAGIFSWGMIPQGTAARLARPRGVTAKIAGPPGCHRKNCRHPRIIFVILGSAWRLSSISAIAVAALVARLQYKPSKFPFLESPITHLYKPPSSTNIPIRQLILPFPWARWLYQTLDGCTSTLKSDTHL